MKYHLKRAYDDATTDDGFRILVDRLWPRGVSKEDAKIDLWLKEIAPSTALRKWFNHDPEKWPEFQKRYRRELDENSDQLKELRGHAKKGKVTLVYSAKDTEHNDAVVLRQYLEKSMTNPVTGPRAAPSRAAATVRVEVARSETTA